MPSWSSVAMAAGAAGLLYGGYMFVTGREAVKNIPVSREKLWHSISAELAQESAGQAPLMVTEQRPTVPEPPAMMEQQSTAIEQTDSPAEAQSGPTGRSQAKSLIDSL